MLTQGVEADADRESRYCSRREYSRRTGAATDIPSTVTSLFTAH